MKYFKEYNAIVNISYNKKTNATNFIDSLFYMNNIIECINLIEYIKNKLKCEVNIYPTFIGKSANEEGYVGDNDEDYIGLSFLFDVEGKKSDSIVKILKKDSKFKPHNIILNKDDDSIKILINP